MSELRKTTMEDIENSDQNNLSILMKLIGIYRGMDEQGRKTQVEIASLITMDDDELIDKDEKEVLILAQMRIKNMRERIEKAMNELSKKTIFENISQ
ncbi:MAG: hypothetical protein KDK36_12840 [Leptospiraceae bacterium]|nr:hypothetical protein [Leptospiraceae bacterium]